MHPGEDELLRMSLTGEVPQTYAIAFSEAKARGNSSFAAGDYHAALKHYEDAANADPTSPIPVSNSALVLLRIGRPEEAVMAASTALELLAAHPDRPGSMQLTVKTLLRRAAARKALDLFALAAHDLCEILILHPGHQEAVQQLRELKSSNPSIEINGDAGGEASRSSTMHRRPQIEELSRASRRNLRGRVNSKYPASGNETANDGQVDGSRERFGANEAQAPFASESNDSASSAGNSPASQEYTTSDALRLLTESCVNSVPRNCAEFENGWRALRSDFLLRSNFLSKTVGATRLQRGLLGDTLTSQFIEEAAEALEAGVTADACPARSAFEVMCAISKAQRFELVVMFLSQQEKQSISRLCDTLLCYGLASTDAYQFRSLYGLT